MKCPMCGLTEKYQNRDKENPQKTKCTGCGCKFFNKEVIVNG